MAKILVYSEMSGDHVKTVTMEILGKLTGHQTDVAIIGSISPGATSDLALLTYMLLRDITLKNIRLRDTQMHLKP